MNRVKARSEAPITPATPAQPAREKRSRRDQMVASGLGISPPWAPFATLSSAMGSSPFIAVIPTLPNGHTVQPAPGWNLPQVPSGGDINHGDIP